MADSRSRVRQMVEDIVAVGVSTSVAMTLVSDRVAEVAKVDPVSALEMRSELDRMKSKMAAPHRRPGGVRPANASLFD